MPHSKFGWDLLRGCRELSSNYLQWEWKTTASCVSSRGVFGSGELNSYKQDFAIIPDIQIYGKSKLENYTHAAIFLY